MQDSTCLDMTKMSYQDKIDRLVAEIQSILQQPGLLNEVLRPQIVGSLVDVNCQEPQLPDKTLKFGMRNWIITNWSLFEEVAEK